MPLGLVPDEIFTSAIEDKTEPFSPGDTLVLYTDGVTEAPNEEEKEFSSARLADVVRALHTRPRARSTTASWRACAGSRATPQRDDLTLVTVKRV
jgi:phosphoserine phosphatase RsbU/P